MSTGLSISKGNQVYLPHLFLLRCLPGNKHGKSNVIVDVEDGLKRGFSVHDVQTFLSCLRMVADMSLIIVDNIDV